MKRIARRIVGAAALVALAANYSSLAGLGIGVVMATVVLAFART